MRSSIGFFSSFILRPKRRSSKRPRSSSMSLVVGLGRGTTSSLTGIIRQKSVLCTDTQKIRKGHPDCIELAFQAGDHREQFEVNKLLMERKMRRNLVVLSLVAAGLAAGVLVRADAARKHAFAPGEMQYGPAPSFIPAGAQLAVLEGDPLASTGDYTVRLKMPSGYRIAPHWHPQRENVTVISGTFKVGMGDRFVESEMAAFPAGKIGRA